MTNDLSQFTNASRDFLALNLGLSSPKSKRPVRNESVGAAQRKTRGAKRYVVRIVSWRVNLLDPDNLCPKYIIDALRYAGAIPDDRDQDIVIQIEQKKVASFQNENTVVEVIYP